MIHRGALILAIALATLVAADHAHASWEAGAGSRSAYSKAQVLVGGNAPTATAAGRNVTISWAAPGGSVPLEGYVVRRYSVAGAEQAVGADCSGIVGGLTCTENGVPPGAWRYTVTPARQNWRGPESSQSAAVTVVAPALELDQGSVSSLPATVTGDIAAFQSGQTVSFRLDNPSTGTLLTGGITPSPVPGNGIADVSVTIPDGTTNGSHTVWAIGSAGDQAPAPLTVAASKTFTTSAWDLRDASGGSESDQTHQVAFASDSRAYTTSATLAAFSTSRYLQFDYNAPLTSGANPSAANFNFRFADSGGGQSCFYFDVRRASTGALIGTHGSSGSPVGCVTGTTLQTFATALPEVNTTAIANDLRVRVYTRASLLSGLIVDQAIVAGSSPQGTFSLYDEAFIDRANGTNVTRTWPLVASAGTTYTVLQPWQSAFSPSRYLKLAFPSYTPPSASVSGATFTHRYRSSGGGTTCYYLELLQGSTVIATKGSAGSPLSCNSSSSAYVTNTVSLPEVNTPARANGAVVKLYVRNSATQRSQHDHAELEVTYSD